MDRKKSPATVACTTALMVCSVQKKESRSRPSGIPWRGSCSVEASAADQSSSQPTPSAAPAAAT